MTHIYRIATSSTNYIDLSGGAFKLSELTYRPNSGDGDITDGHTLVLSGQSDEDATISQLAALVDMLKQGRNYNNPRRYPEVTTPVYLWRKGEGVTNAEYSLLKNFTLENYESPLDVVFKKLQMHGLPLTLTHEGWAENPPGSKTAVQMTQVIPDSQGYVTYVLATYAPFVLWPFNETSGTTADNAEGTAGLDGTYDTVTLNDLIFPTGDPAAFVDLGAGNVDIYTAALDAAFDGDEFTIGGFIRTSGVIWTSGNEHWLWTIRTATSQINCYKTTTDYEVVFERITPADTKTITITFSNPVGTLGWMGFFLSGSVTAGYMTAYARGIKTSVILEQAWNGSLSSSGCYIGAEDGTGTNSLSADISHFMIFDKVLTDAEVYDILIKIYGQIPADTDDPVTYLANKHNAPRLSHVFYYDDSLTTFSSNLLDSSVPFALLPTTPAVNDYLILGIEADAGNPEAIPDSAIFDLSVAAADITITPKYYNGSWTALSVTNNNLYDDTQSFSRTGKHYITFTPPSDHTTVTVNSVSGRWLKLEVTAIGSAPTAPTQQNRIPYTVNWPFAEVDSQWVPGDIDTKIQWLLEGTRYAGNTKQESKPSRIIAGTRSLSRGSEFTSFLHVNEASLPVGITVSMGTGWAVGDSGIAYARKRATYTISAGSSTIATGPRWKIDGEIAKQYAGKFRAIARIGYDSAIADGDYFFALRTVVGNTLSGVGIQRQTDTVTPYTSTDTDYTYQIVDFGNIEIVRDIGENFGTIYITLMYGYTSGANPNNAYLYDLVLIPVDEWFIETSPTVANINLANPSTYTDQTNSALDIDGVSPRVLADAVQRWPLSSNSIWMPWKVISPGPPVLRYGQSQRLWVLQIYGEYDEACNALPDMLLKVNCYRNARYSVPRGDS